MRTDVLVAIFIVVGCIVYALVKYLANKHGYNQSKDYKSVVSYLSVMENEIPSSLNKIFVICRDSYIQGLPKDFELSHISDSVEHHVYMVFTHPSFYRVLFIDSMYEPKGSFRDFIKLHDFLFDEAVKKGYYTQEDYEHKLKARGS